MSGPIGIVSVIIRAAVAGFREILWVTILINVALAVFNLLPIPVLDGGHIVFAAIARVRGRPLPFELIARLQTAFVLLLLAMMLYVSFHDVRRLAREGRPPPEAKPASTEPPQASPAPAKP